jgi:hypothetical protein
VRLTLIAAVLVGCYDPDVPLGIPCSDTGECPTGQECDQLSNTCMGPTELRVWRDDSAADFAQPTAVLIDIGVESAGFIGSAPYATGRLRVSGIDADTIADAMTTPWSEVSAGAITGVGFESTADIDYGSAAPRGVRLSNGDNVTVLVEGEIHLDAAGVWRFELDANEKGFLELAAPGADFERVVVSENSSVIDSYMVTTPGWYRMRGAFTDTGGDMAYSLTVDPPNVPGNLRPIASDRIRARVDQLSGYILDAFEWAYMVENRGSTVLGEPLDVSYGTDPLGFEIGTSAWSMRFSGQMLIDVEGDYAFSISSGQGHRVWLDGELVADKLGTTASQTTTPPMLLAAGWHDIVVDITKNGGATPLPLRVTVESGPAWVGQPIPADHVRPLPGRGSRWTAAASGTALAVPDGATATRTISLDVPAGMTPLAAHAAYEIDHPLREQVSVVLDPPVGSNITELAAGGQSSPGTYFDYDDVTAFGTLSYKQRQTTTAKVQLRTCDAADACATEPWIDVADAAVPAVPARRFAQYAVELTSDGDVPSALDWIEINYSTRKQ